MPTYIDPKTKKTVDLASYGDAGAQNLQANRLGLDVAPSTAITAQSLATATPIIVPEKPTPAPVDTTTGQAVIDTQTKSMATQPPAGWDAVTYANFKKANPTLEPDAEDTRRMLGISEPKPPSAIESFLTGLKAPGSQTEAYKTAYGASGLATQEQDVLAKQRVVKTAQGKLGTINAQLEALNAEAKAIPIQVQQESTARGITAAGAAPLTTARLRENALKALPLQAQALAAQAEVQSAQGDVELAQNSMKMASDRLTTLFTMQSKDMENEYNHNKDLRDKVYTYLSDKEKTQLAKLQKEDDRNFELMKDNINNAQELSKSALAAGQADLAARITQLDPKSKTYTQDLAALQAEIRPDTLDRTYKQLQIQKMQQELAGGTDKILSPAEATTLGVPYGTTQSQAAALAQQGTGTTPKALEQINLVRGSLNRAKELAGASGRSGVRKTIESWLVGSTDYTNLVAETNTLRTNVLTMMTDPAIKKFFGPQMSNADVQLMTSAGTTLNPELQNADNMRKELGRLEDLVARAENAVKQGSTGEQVSKEQEILRTKYNY